MPIADAHHPAVQGDVLKSGRYKILAPLGRGHFSAVHLAYDGASRRAVAVKIQRAGSRYTNAAREEKALLQSVATASASVTAPTPASASASASFNESVQFSAPASSSASATAPMPSPSAFVRGKEDRERSQPRVVQLLDHFAHTGPRGRHTCLVFPVLGCSLLEVVKAFGYRGAPREGARAVSRAVVEAVACLHGAGVIHTDLKLENVLLVPRENEVRALNEAAARAAAALCAGKGEGGGNLKRNRSKRKKAKAKAKAKAKKEREGGDVDDMMREGEAGRGEAFHKEEERQEGAASTSVGNRDEDSLKNGSVMSSGITSGVDAEEEGHARDKVLLGDGNTDADETETSCKEGATEGDGAQKRVESATVGALKSGSATAFRNGAFDVEEFFDYEGMFNDGRVCIIDLGNACHISSDTKGVIQTRQYRSPEVIIGARFGPSADIWSVACLIFELLTGEFLFDPHGGDGYDSDEDHVGQIIELLGPMPRFLTSRGIYSKELFNRHGELRHVHDLTFWSLERVLMEKYKFGDDESREIGECLRNMLQFDVEKRVSAEVCLQHPFFDSERRGSP